MWFDYCDSIAYVCLLNAKTALRRFLRAAPDIPSRDLFTLRTLCHWKESVNHECNIICTVGWVHGEARSSKGLLATAFRPLPSRGRPRVPTSYGAPWPPCLGWRPPSMRARRRTPDRLPGWRRVPLIRSPLRRIRRLQAHRQQAPESGTAASPSQRTRTACIP